MPKNTATITEVEDTQTEEIRVAEAALERAKAEQVEANKRAADPGEQIGAGRWRRLPPAEPEQARIRSDASWKVRQAEMALDAAKRPKLSMLAAAAGLAGSVAALDDARQRLAKIHRDAETSDPEARLRALDADRDAAARAVRRAQLAVEVSRQVLADAERRDREARGSVFEGRAREVVARLDKALANIAPIVDEALALHAEAGAAGVAMFDAGIPAGLMPENTESWRSQQKRSGRL